MNVVNVINILHDKKYKSDEAFKVVNKNFLTLLEDECRRNNQILNQVLHGDLIPLMQEDEVFKNLFKKINYSGSYYKGTRFGTPDEFDLDFVFELPVDYRLIKIDTNHENHGFVKINCKNLKFTKHEQLINNWLTYEGYLDQNKFRSWFESVFTKAINKLPPATPSSRRIVSTEVRMRKSGPAFTLHLKCRDDTTFEIDVDLVPSLEFSRDLGDNYRHLGSGNNIWQVVPKPVNNVENSHVFWRLSFYVHEKKFLDGHLKDVIKMMKKFRDTQNLTDISSYLLENIFYNDLLSQSDTRGVIQHTTKTSLVMLGLKQLQKACETKQLFYFWNSKFNLFGKIKDSTLENYSDRLKKLIKKIDDKIESNPETLVDIVISSKEKTSILNDLFSSLRVGY